MNPLRQTELTIPTLISLSRQKKVKWKICRAPLYGIPYSGIVSFCRTWSTIFALVTSFYLGCSLDAPHDNPLDPLSPKFENAGTVQGRVLSLGSSTVGIANALVTFANTHSATFTDNNGNFSANHISSGTILIIVTKDGFLTDSVSLQLAAGQTSSLEIHLDALPQISGQKIITKKIDQWWPGPTYSALVTAMVNDPDGQADIASVFVTVDSFKFEMKSPNSDNNFQATIFGDSLPNGNLQWLVGRTLTVRAQDKERATAQSDSFFVSRIIEATAIPTSPTAQDTVGDTLYFQWDPPSLNFPYTFTINLYSTNSGILPWSKSNITPAPPFAYTLVPSPPLNGGFYYYWTITVVDEFGNSARSKEASFFVPQP